MALEGATPILQENAFNSRSSMYEHLWWGWGTTMITLCFMRQLSAMCVYIRGVRYIVYRVWSICRGRFFKHFSYFPLLLFRWQMATKRSALALRRLDATLIRVKPNCTVSLPHYQIWKLLKYSRRKSIARIHRKTVYSHATLETYKNTTMNCCSSSMIAIVVF